MKTHWVMDYETLVNCFVAVFEDYKADNIRVYVVHESRNDLPEFIRFLEQNIQEGQWHISYNGLQFDSQITHWILDNKNRLLSMDGDSAAREISAYAQKVISDSNERKFSDYPSWRMKIRQIDIFKLNHWDSKAKKSSLKWIQYAMDWENVEEMPIHHTTEITTQEQLDQIISYCINDVKSTKAAMQLSREQIELRASLTIEYDIDLYNASEPRISKELFAHFLAPKLGIDKKQLKELRTHRDRLECKDIILSNIQFETSEFNSVLNWFRNLTINFSSSETDGDREKRYKFSINYRGVQTDYGLGGIHGARNAGIYEARDGFIIMTSDVTSFYPNLAIKNRFCPAHLPTDAFLEQYEWFFDERKKIPKSDPRNYVYKIILNSTYGLSKDIHSYLYDPRFTMQITINGQLQLSMLYEMLAEGIPGAIPLMQNTDGLEIMIPAEYKEKYLQICAAWEQITKLQLEHDQYSKMFIWDVNNYIAVSTNGKTKCKGRFEWEDLDKKKTASLHKNKSFLVIPKAIYNYFVNGISPEDYLEQNRNIYDYCGGVKVIGDWHFESQYLRDGVVCNDRLQKMIRYYVSHEGTKLVKVHNYDGREIQVESGRWRQTIANDIRKLPSDFEQLDINKQYYLQQIYKEINTINSKVSQGYVQGELF